MREIIKTEKLKSLKDVENFFKEMNIYFGLNWSPDADFETYDLEESEKVYISSSMDSCWNLCEKLNVDIYLFGLEINKQLREKFGIVIDILN